MTRRLVRWAGSLISALLAAPAALDRVHRRLAAVPPAVPELRRRLGGLRRLPARRPGEHGLLRAAPVEVPVHRGRGHRHPARRGRVVRLHDDPGGPALAVVRAVRAGGASAGRPVPVAQLPHAPDRRAPGPAAAPAEAAATPASAIAAAVARAVIPPLPMHEGSARGAPESRFFRFPRAETVMSSSSARVSMKARRASDSRAAQLLARAGLTGRGVIYILIGIVAFLVAIGQGGHQADQQGALQLVAGPSRLAWSCCGCSPSASSATRCGAQRGRVRRHR